MEAQELESANYPESARDLKCEEKVYEEMKTFQNLVNASMRDQKELDPSAKEKMESLYKEMDGITRKIDDVVSLREGA